MRKLWLPLVLMFAVAWGLPILAAMDMTVGTASGMPGGAISLNITTANNGEAPIGFSSACPATGYINFDSTKLTFVSLIKGPATSGIGSITLNANELVPGHVCFSMLDNNLGTIPEGVVIVANFTINPAATPSITPVTLMPPVSASDIVPNPITVNVHDGQVFISAMDMTVGTASGLPGTAVSIPITTANNGNSPIGFSSSCPGSGYINYDTTQLTFTSLVKGAVTIPIGSITLNSAENVLGHVCFAMLDNNLGTIPSGEVMVAHFNINPGANCAVPTPVSIVPPVSASDSVPNTIPVNIVNGQVVVTTAAAAAPTVTDINKCLLDGVYVTWADVPGASSYDLQVDGVTDVIGVTSPHTYLPGDSAVHTYAIRANAGACTGAWSTTTNGTDINNGIATMAAPGVTDISACALSGVSITFVPEANATSTELRVDGTTSIVNVTSPWTYVPGDSLPHVYEVRGLNADCVGAWSLGTTGTDVDDSMLAPTVTVADIDPCAVTGVSITWAPVAKALSYELRVDGTTSVVNVTSPWTYVPGDSASHNYQVRGLNASCEGAWSANVAGIDANNTPTCAVGPSPISGAIDVPIGSTLTWAAVAGATSYDVYFGTVNPPPFVANVLTNSYTPVLALDTDYFWSIVPRHDTCVAAGCAIWTFHTIKCTITCSATGPVTGISGVPYQFTATSTVSDCVGVVHYLWAFGDGDTTTQQNPMHTYLSGGTFTWTMTAEINGAICTATGTVTIGFADLVLYDDYGRSKLCASSTTGQWVWTVMVAPNVGTYEGVGIVQVLNGVTYLTSPNGVPDQITVKFFGRYHKGYGSFINRVKRVQSTLYDSNTLNDPPGC